MISATFQADFTSFLSAVDKADLKLKGLSEGAGRVGPAMDRMVGKAPGDLDRLDRSSRQSEGGLKALHGSVDQVDRVLNAAGLSLGPIPSALRELGNVSGKTASDLGLLATGALSVSAAFVGWNVGRKIAEFAGTDKIIADATASLLGWGNVAKEEAAAGADFLARASVQAGREIKTMDEALKVMTTATFVPFSERVKGAEGEVTRLTASQIAEIESAQRLGTTTAELTRHFGISEGALKVLGERTREQEKASRDAEAATKKHSETVRALFSRDDIDRALLYSGALGDVRNVSQLTKEKKEELRKVVGEALEAYKALGEEAPRQLQAIFNATFDLNAETRKLHEKELPALTGLLENLTREIGTYDFTPPWKKLGGTSREELQKTADAARTTYETALTHSDKFTGQQILDFQRAADEAQAAADRWGSDVIDTYDAIKRKSGEAADKQVEDAKRVALSWSEAMKQGLIGGTVSSRGGTPFSAEERARMEQMFKEGRYSGPIKNYTTDPWGKVMGGEIDWDRLNQMHGIQPSIAPTVRATGSASASIAVTNNITQPLGTPQAISAAVNDAMTQWARSIGMRLPSGA